MSLASSATSVGTRIGRSTRYGTGRVRKPAFYLVTAGFLAFLVFALNESMAMAATAWGSEYAFPGHRVHHAMIGGMLTVFAATIAVQLYRPAKRVGALQAAVTFAIAAFVVTLVASGPAAAGGLLVFLVPVLVIAALHPARDQLVPSLERADTRLLGLAIVGALGFAVVAVGEYASHATLGDEHVLFGHYEFMTFALVSIGLFALLAALRPVGWRALAYAAAAIAALFAASSLAFPGLEQGSSLGPVAALAVIVWAVAFVGLAEYVDRTDSRGSEPAADPEP
ncbi:hypothetical protein [Natrarchaeobius chitinivorans]|uniref:Uncharacterized protein n=1 Tax=Natrarchaeobius chitinivorans TaxID=1679083 RepID=A0A3N6M153_NATCH|nr:hypothetical protein [Natrarchaeobius chitinivorans]RQG94054.1 hypothetical protein EA473_13375 [Natrarchaeobius chitinivorans]